MREQPNSYNGIGPGLSYSTREPWCGPQVSGYFGISVNSVSLSTQLCTVLLLVADLSLAFAVGSSLQRSALPTETHREQGRSSPETISFQISHKGLS